MNWITTNIRFPEELYMELKMEAAKKRKSVAALVREKVSGKKKITKASHKNLLREMDKIAEELAKQNKGLNLTKALIEMRYEQ